MIEQHPKGYTFLELGRHGALGNQMWQIAGTLGKAFLYKVEAKFLDWDYRPWFSIPDQLFGDVPTSYTNLYPSYLQDIDYFRHFEDAIRKIFAPSEMAEETIKNLYPGINFKHYVAVHVRRANNLALPEHHPVCPLAYFETTIHKLRQFNIHKTPYLMVFSDDLEWCKQQDIFKGALFARGNPSDIDVNTLTNQTPVSLPSVALDLLTMAKCGAHIISNSTFSWWAAFLSDNYRTPDSVIYPARWYGPKVDANPELMFGDLPWVRWRFQADWGIG